MTKDDKIKKLEALLKLVDEGISRTDFEDSFKKVLEIVQAIRGGNEKEWGLVHKNLLALQEKLKQGAASDVAVIKEAFIQELKNLFTQAEKKIASIKDEVIQGKDGKDGKDGKPGKDADETEIVDKVLAKIPTLEDIENKLPILGTKFRDGLELLQDEERLDASAVKNLPEVTEKIVTRAGWGAHPLRILDDGDIVDKVARIINFTGTAITKSPDGTINIPVGSGSGSDEKVKYDAGDPTAGYVADKIIAGTGISVAEGAGGDANKLVITNSLPRTIDGSGSANEMAYWVDSDTLGTLTVATYPSLTELSYVKGVSSALQTQLGNKQPLDTQLTSLAALSYAGNALKLVRVNAGETDFELAAPTGGGDVSKVGVPVNNQVGVWTGDGTLEGDASLTFDTTTDTLATVLITATTVTAALVGNASTASSAAKWTTARNLAGNSVDGSGDVAFANKFIVQGTVDTGLSGAQFLGALTTGLVKNTTTTGVLSIATAGSDYAVGSLGLAGGQTIAGSTLTAENLTLRANAADLTTGQINVTSSKEATNTTTAAVAITGGLAVAKRIWALDMTVTNTIMGTTSGNLTSLSGAVILAGIAGGQTLNGSTLTTENLTLRANAADLTTGQVNITSSKEATNTTTAAVAIAGGLAVAKRIYALDMTVTNTITGAITGLAGSATVLATSRNLWGQAFTGAADVTGSLTAVGDITGGASSMIIQSGTGASRTLVFKTTTVGSAATTALTLAADQSATFANTVNATTFIGALTGTASGNALPTLANLGVVAINTDLIDDTDITDDLGSLAVRWDGIYAATLNTGDTAGDTLKLRGYDVDGAAFVDILTITANNTVTADLNTGVTIGGAYVYRVSGTDVAVLDGGTGLSAITALSIWVANSANTITEVTPGAGNSIRINAGGTAWEAYTPGAGGYTNLTQFVAQTAWRVFYSNTDGDVTELALGADGTFLKSNGASSAPTFAIPTGSGDVTKVGTPVDNQIGVWTGDGTLEGDPDFLWGGSSLTMTNTTDAASVQSAIIQGDRATIADGDEAYVTFRLSDSAGNQDEGARITWKATTVLSGATQDTDLIFSALVNNVLTTMLTLDGSASEIVPAVKINSAAAITGTAITGSSFVIGANTLDTNEWAFLDGQNQAVATGSSPTFVNLTITSFAANWTNAGRTVADAGILTTVDINGGTLDGVTIGGASAAAATVTTLGAGAITSTGLLTVSLAGNAGRFVNTTDNASVQVVKLEGDRATMADNDEAYLSLILSNDGGTQSEFARITWIAVDVNAGTNIDGSLVFSVTTAGSLAKELVLDGTSFSPVTTDGNSLGTTSLNWSDLYLDLGAVIDWDSGDLVLTHSANTLTLTGGNFVSTLGATTLAGTVSGGGQQLNNIIIGTVTPLAGAFTTVSGTSVTFTTNLISTTALATPAALAATQFTGFASTVSGAAIMGYGTTNDVSLMNRAGTVVLGVGPNTTVVNIPGSLTAATINAFTLAGTIAGGGNQLNNIIIGTSTPLAGTFTAVIGNSFVPNSSTIPSDGMYLPAASTLGWSIGSAIEMQLTATALSPGADGGSSLGTTTLGWQNLFGNTGFVLNIENGDFVATHTAGILTIGTGELRNTNAGTNTASVVTVGGTQTLTAKTLTSPTLTTPSAFTTGGVITLAENTSIAFDPAGSADGKYSGITVTGTGGATIAFGDLVTLDKDDSRWELVDISVAAAATGDARGIIGMCVLASTDGAAITVLLNGIIRADANFPALTIGAAVFASTTGDIVVTQPTTTDYVIRIVGYALTADEIYFNPENDWTSHT
jgi:hypothetical protein